MCNNEERIIGFVYGEIDDSERLAFEAHLATCAACRNEVAQLRAARGHLAAWAPPEPDFGFRIVRDTPRAVTPAAGTTRRFGFGWGLAAAAILVLATAAAIANVEIRYDAQGLVVRTGWSQDAAPATLAAAQGGGGTAVVPAALQAEIDSLKKQVRALENASASRESSGVVLAVGERMSDEQILRRMRDMVNQSEARQREEFRVAMTQFANAVDAARQMDFVRVQQGFGQLRSQTTAEVANQWNQMLTRVSQQK